MKSIIKRRAKSALAILLTLCMVMSVFTIGVVSASAATDNSEGVGAIPSTIYFKAGSSWDDADFDLKTAFNSGGDVWTDNHSSYVFTVSVPSGATSGTFCRMNPSNHNDQWNYDTFTLDSNGKDLYVQNSGGDKPGGTWYKKAAYDDLSETIGSGTGSKHAVGRIYFDNSSVGWTGTLYFVVAHGSYVKAYAMSKITGTNLYYVNQTNDTWSDAKYYGVMASSSTLNSTWTNGTSSTYATLASESSITNYAIPYSGTFNMNNSSSTYILNHTISNNKVTITEPTYTSSGYSYFNHNQNVQARIPDGSGWKNAGSDVATLSINSYVLSGNGTSATATTNGTSGSAVRNTAYTSSVTMTASASSSSYVFAGWGTSSSTIDSSLGTGNYVYTATNSTKTIYAFFDLGTTELPTPTWSTSTIAVNSGTAATLTVGNHNIISGQDSGVTYELYKDDSLLTENTDYTYNNGVFTLIDTTTEDSGSYTVKAIAANTTQYRDSAISTSSATLTVYEPIYCLVGNVDKSTIIKNGNVITPTAPSGSNSYWNTWQDQLIVNETTDKPGVYRITVKINEGSERETANIGLYLNGSGQKAFRLGNTDYNTSGKDLTITDAGIADGDNLYVNNLGTLAGGSIVLKKGQTYTITIDQTQRYNNSSSYPWGKITITTTDAFVDAFAKMQSFNATTGAYEAITDASATVGTASASPVHGSKTTGFESTLTAATVNNNYTFQGWYSDAACTQSVSTDAAHSLTNVTESAQYYALFKQNMPAKYTVTADTPGSGTIDITDGVSNNQAYQGATISINATVTDNSKEFSHWSILTDTANPVDITSTVCANPTQAQTTLTMPGQNIRIVAFFAARTPLNITVSSNNNELGTASYNTQKTYYVGDEVTIEATNKGGVFSRWVVTGGTVANATSASTKITSTGATVTARAVFDYKTYQLYYNGKYYPLIRQSDGTYVSTFKIPSNSSTFTVYNASDKKYAVSGTDDTWEFNAGTRDATIYNSTTANDSAWASSVGKQYKNTSAGAAAYMVFYPPGYKIGNTTYGNGQISLVIKNPMGDIAAVYAKDGTIRYKANKASTGDLWDEGGDVTCKRGVTTVTQINSTAVPNPDSTRYDNHCRIYSAPIGSTITIETQVNNTYKDQGFYVGMFVINGWKVNATDIGNGKYTATYTLSDEYNVVNLSDHGSQKSFEITPVYYNKNFEYVTFYVDAKSVPSKWKGTISTCADYRSTDGKSAGSSHFEGSYPGQPLGREGDLYEIKVAKYYYDKYNSTTKKWDEHTNYFPSATITAYNYDQVHHYYYVNKSDDLNGSTTNSNYQTYDYADFSYLAQIKDIEAIMFRCKETTNNNRDHMSHWNYDFTGHSFELLTDYYGRPIDALGNVLKDNQGNVLDASDLTESDAHVKILSVGNENTSSTDNRTKAQWSTKWIAYNLDINPKKAVTMVSTPADYIDTNINTPGATANRHITFSMNDGTSSEQDISALQNKVTYISYDEERANVGSLSGDNNNTGVRIDGQWYYSAQHDFDSTVQVHITTDEGTAVTKANTNVDADSSTAGTNDGWEGTTSKSVATLDGKTTETYSNVTTEAQLNATVGAGYTFVGWYIYDGTTYTKIHDNFVDQNTTMTMKKNYTIVAVVRKVAAGDLVITHSRYTGPGANDGTGKYYVSAVVNKGQANEKTIPEALNSITVQNLQSTDKLTITIRTVCNGADTFYAWYEEALGDNYSRTGNYYEICSEDVDPIGEKEVSYTFFEADCSTFFKNGTLARNTIDLYSDITHVSAYAKLTYKYYDRFAQNGKGQMVSYVVKDVPLSNTEIDNGYIPSDEKIAQYAPKVVDTIYTDTKWSIVGTKVERAASNVTLMATQTAKTCYVQYLPNDVVGNYLLQSTTKETDVQSVTAWNTRIVDFNTWLINDDANLDAPDESDFYVSAPTTYTYQGTTWNFVKFDIYEFDRLTGEIGDVIYSTNDNVFGYRIYADCVIYPVYTKDSVTKELTAKIEPAVLNREVYGDSTSPVDRLYADLIISFINIAAATGGNVPEVIKENDTEYTIETGVILDKSVNLTDTDYNTIKHDAETGQTDTTNTIIKGYTGFTDIDTVKNFAKTAVADSTTRKVTIGNLTKYVNNNSDLTNKNRLDKVFRYTNSTDAQKRIFAAYSYVLIKKKNGDQVAFAISDVQKFNFCYTGNKPLSTLS